MKEYNDSFEHRLRQPPLKPVPPAWRAEILAATHVAQRHDASSFIIHPSSFARLRACLWPHPVAWAGLAAAWLFIGAVNLSLHVSAPARLAEKDTPPSPLVLAELKKQQRLYAELVGAEHYADSPPEMTPPKETPETPRRPRTKSLEALCG